MVQLWKELQGEKGYMEPAVEGHIQSSKPGVIVTISREHGSAGKRIGQMAAEMLQIPCYYKEVTALAAQESGLAAEFISDINKNLPDRLKELYLSTKIVQQAIVAQDKIIKKIADSGSCVIVGRAADYVLRDYADVVRIFIRAPKEYRMKNYQSVTGSPWSHCGNYELCIDSSVGEQACAEMILAKSHHGIAVWKRFC